MNGEFPFKFGKYRMEAEIGRGGFGNVFRATDIALDRPVAIKILDPLLMRDQHWVARFRSEARVMARLDHPNIVVIHEIGEENGHLYIAMKLVDGPDLSSYLHKSGPLPWDTVTNFTNQIASALDYAHGQGVIHRDLKPGNILVNDSSVLLTDFGLAKIVQENTQSVSLTEGQAGTYNYIPPEIFNDQQAGPPADIYALGLVVYEMLTGSKLVDNTSTAAIIATHLKGVVIDQPLPESVPPGVKEVLQTAVAINPTDRYASARLMAAALAGTATTAPKEPIIPEQKAPVEIAQEESLPEKSMAALEVDQTAPTGLPKISAQEPPPLETGDQSELTPADSGNRIPLLRSAALWLGIFILNIILRSFGYAVIFSIFLFPIIVGILTSVIWRRSKPSMSTGKMVLAGVISGLLFLLFSFFIY